MAGSQLVGHCHGEGEAGPECKAKEEEACDGESAPGCQEDCEGREGEGEADDHELFLPVPVSQRSSCDLACHPCEEHQGDAEVGGEDVQAPLHEKGGKEGDGCVDSPGPEGGGGKEDEDRAKGCQGERFARFPAFVGRMLDWNVDNPGKDQGHGQGREDEQGEPAEPEPHHHRPGKDGAEGIPDVPSHHEEGGDPRTVGAVGQPIDEGEGLGVETCMPDGCQRCAGKEERVGLHDPDKPHEDR